MMPRVIGDDSLIARVNEVQGCMYRQSNELGRLNKAVKRYKDENAKLRKFVYDMWNDMNVYYTQHESPDSSDMDFYRNSMRELGIEVDG